MRQRNVKNLEEKLRNHSTYRVEDPRAWKGRWKDVFQNANPLFLEIGCGKGKFLTEMADRKPEQNFIGVEGQSNVLLRALEKAEGRRSGNLRLFQDYVHDLNDYFEKGELSGIYLNFSDPWPKARHAKRRLTYRDRLTNYFQVLGRNGFVEVKTDNEDLFQFTLEEIAASSLVIAEMTRDLHGADCTLESRLVTTEYEERFCSVGKNINYVKIKNSCGSDDR